MSTVFWYNRIIRKAVFFYDDEKCRQETRTDDDVLNGFHGSADHMLRLIDKAINWNFIYDLVEDKYCQNNGRPSMDPVMLIKIPFIQYLYGIKSMRQTIREIEVNVAYRWFLGLICWILYRIFQRLERFIPADLKTRIFLNRYFQRFWKNVCEV